MKRLLHRCDLAPVGLPGVSRGHPVVVSDDDEDDDSSDWLMPAILTIPPAPARKPAPDAEESTDEEDGILRDLEARWDGPRAGSGGDGAEDEEGEAEDKDAEDDDDDDDGFIVGDDVEVRDGIVEGEEENEDTAAAGPRYPLRSRGCVVLSERERRRRHERLRRRGAPPPPPESEPELLGFDQIGDRNAFTCFLVCHVEYLAADHCATERNGHERKSLAKIALRTNVFLAQALSSGAWPAAVRADLDRLPALLDTDYCGTEPVPDECAVCHRARCVTRTLVLSGVPYDVRDYERFAWSARTGRDAPAIEVRHAAGAQCVERAALYHEMRHFRRGLVQRCARRLDALRAARPELAGPPTAWRFQALVDAVVADKAWIAGQYRLFAALLARATEFVRVREQLD